MAMSSHRLAVRLIACLAGNAAVMALLASPAEAQLTRKGVVIVGKRSGKCATVPDGASGAGTSVVQTTCGVDSTAWELVPSANHFRVVATHSRGCLAVPDGGASGPVVHGPCAGADGELWSVESAGRFYRLVSKASRACLHVANGSETSGARLVAGRCGAGDREKWMFGGGFVGPADPVRIVSSRTRLCAGTAASGGAPTASACVRAARDQIWTLQRFADGYRVRRAGHAQELWRVERSEGGFRIASRHTGRCLDLADDAPARGSALVERTCDGRATQLWQLTAEHELGSWSSVIPLPLVPVGAAALRNGKVLFWAAYDELTFGGNNGKTQTALFDPATGAVVAAEVSNTQHDMFCPGTALLGDGRLLVNGGSSSSRTSIYNPGTNAWAASGTMNVSRGYNADALLANGRVFTIGGSWSGGQGGKLGEVWAASSGAWSRRTGIPATAMTAPDPAGVYRGDNHAWLFATGNGVVFHAGPSVEMNWFDTAGSGTTTPAGPRSTDSYSMCGSAVMYDVNRILKLGGAPAYDNANALASAYVIDIGAGVAVTQTGSLAFARTYQNSVVLPDGRVFVAGGQAFGVPFSDAQSVLAGEIWSEGANGFTTVASASVPRNYHSIALLLPDARVLVGGGGLCGTTCQQNHPDLEFYSPGYLFDPSGLPAARPVIVTAPSNAQYGTAIAVTTSSAVASFVFIRMSSVTHSVNNDQRRVPATITAEVGTAYTVMTPANSGIAPPGYYMLFALDAAGVPSVARILRIR
jgi:galactose oxidase